MNKVVNLNINGYFIAFHIQQHIQSISSYKRASFKAVETLIRVRPMKLEEKRLVQEVTGRHPIAIRRTITSQTQDTGPPLEAGEPCRLVQNPGGKEVRSHGHTFSKKHILKDSLNCLALFMDLLLSQS